MDWASIMSAVSNGVQATNSLLSPLWQTISDNRRFRYANEAAEKENQRMIEFWNMQNEYNTPKSQMQRFIDAGLSPNLMYGQIQNSNAGDIGRPAVATQEYNVDPQTITNGLSENLMNLMRVMSAKKQLEKQGLENSMLRAQLFGEGALGNFLFGKRKLELEGLGFANELKKESKEVIKRRAGVLGNQINWYNLSFNRKLRDLDQRIRLNGLRAAYQEEVNNWYEANQYFNMINTGIRTLSDIALPSLRLFYGLKKGGGALGGNVINKTFNYNY